MPDENHFAPTWIVYLPAAWFAARAQAAPVSLSLSLYPPLSWPFGSIRWLPLKDPGSEAYEYANLHSFCFRADETANEQTNSPGLLS